MDGELLEAEREVRVRKGGVWDTMKCIKKGLILVMMSMVVVLAGACGNHKGMEKTAGSTLENGLGKALSDRAVLEADGYYWIRYEDGSWSKFDAQGRYVEEKVYTAGAGETYRIRKYTTDKYGYTYIFQELEYSGTTDELIADFAHVFVVAEERPLDGEPDEVVRKIWYNYKQTGLYMRGAAYVHPDKEVTVRIYENGDSALSDGWN